VASATATGKCDHASSILLVSRHCGVGDLAHSSGVYAQSQVGRVAYGRARILPCDWASLLVAGCSALAECFTMAGIVDHLVPFSRYIAVRYPFRISCFLRPRGLSSLLLRIAAIRPFGARRSGVRGRADVDLRHRCLSRDRGNSHHALALSTHGGSLWRLRAFLRRLMSPTRNAAALNVLQFCPTTGSSPSRK